MRPTLWDQSVQAAWCWLKAETSRETRERSSIKRVAMTSEFRSLVEFLTALSPQVAHNIQMMGPRGSPCGMAWEDIRGLLWKQPWKLTHLFWLSQTWPRGWHQADGRPKSSMSLELAIGLKVSRHLDQSRLRRAPCVASSSMICEATWGTEKPRLAVISDGIWFLSQAWKLRSAILLLFKIRHQMFMTVMGRVAYTWIIPWRILFGLGRVTILDSSICWGTCPANSQRAASLRKSWTAGRGIWGSSGPDQPSGPAEPRWWVIRRIFFFGVFLIHIVILVVAVFFSLLYNVKLTTRSTNVSFSARLFERASLCMLSGFRRKFNKAQPVQSFLTGF